VNASDELCGQCCSDRLTGFRWLKANVCAATVVKHRRLVLDSYSMSRVYMARNRLVSLNAANQRESAEEEEEEE
jgi:hypothetical protein